MAITPVFINNSNETFTPTQSGAIATVILECCKEAKKQAIAPWVVSRDCSAECNDWAETVLVPFPHVGSGPVSRAFWRAERKLTGWQHLGQRIYALRIARVLKRHRLEGPFVLSNDPEMAVMLRGLFPNAVIVHWFHNPVVSKPAFRERYRASVDATVAVSGYIASRVQEIYGIPRATTILNGVDLEQYHPATEGHWQASKLVVGFVGRTGVEKAPDLLLAAALRLSETTDRFELQIVGSNHWDRLEVDDYQRRLCDQAAELEARGIPVRRFGHLPRKELPAALRRAHIHVVPSRWEEPCALTLFEGMATGLATVASRTGGTPEVLREAGPMFAKDDAAELAGILALWVSQPDAAREAGKRARQRAEQLPWSRTWNGVFDLLESL